MPRAEELLSELISFPSTPGKEHDAMLYFEQQLQSLEGIIERVPFPSDFKKDPEYSSPISSISYGDRFNIRFAKEGVKEGRTLVINAHMDVVPASKGMEQPWRAARRDGTIYGRGACDDKGPLVAVFLALSAIDRLDLDIPGRIIFHVVNEEENGGNGTLAMIRRGEKAEGCIVMEPSAGKLFTSIRGAVWFRIRFSGTAGHSGQAERTRSALLMAHKSISALQEYHADLLEQSRDVKEFEHYSNPMPLTFGRLHSGNWPASAPDEAELEGVLGFLPNKNREEICEEFEQVLVTDAGLEPSDFELSFTYRHECSVVNPDSELPSTMLSAANETGIPLKADAFPASCDAWFYPHFLSIPAVVYGPGDLQYAHSANEQIDLDQIVDSAELLLRTILRFCPYSKTVDSV